MDLQKGRRMLGDIKSRFGFGSKDEEESYDTFGNYGGYDEYADDYDDDYEERDYAPYAPVTTRSTSGTSMPRLVSIEDVRANTQMSAPSYDSSARRASDTPSSRSFGRTMVDSSLPPEMTPEGTAAVSAAASRRRSDGLDSLFSPTTDDHPLHAAHAHTNASASTSSYTPSSTKPQLSTSTHEVSNTIPGTTPRSSYTGKRTLTVIKPTNYGDVEPVARSLKAGDVVILSLGNTPEALSKRILDFSFGVASALDATVECIDNKVFALTRGSAVSEVERMNLRNQGVVS